ncbi:aspartate/glutamate racemase family protein [Romboutsia sp.]|uniref:aspartate/glutamate racemase family protein n=1 Tax=Romboutsia sp. TaxID=1965302 RepID=UPI003F39087E
MSKTVGVLGGLGPMATVYFYEMVVRMTEADKDQEHIDMVIVNKATTPDRTAYIIGESDENPCVDIIINAKKLENFGVDILAIPCNTAHYFYNEIQSSVNVPIVHMPRETAAYIKANGYKKVGILATRGTIKARVYQNICEEYNIEYEMLDEENQSLLMDIIYKDIKSGKAANMDNFRKIISYLQTLNCDCVILGCTELSILKNDNNLDDKFYIDSMDILAQKVIELSGKNIKK